MNLSNLNRRAILLVKETKRGPAGEVQEVWVEVEQLWVSKPVLMSGKLPQLGQKSSEVRMYRFQSIWRPTVTEYCRIMIQGVTHDIVSAEEKGMHESLEITTMVTK